MSIIHLIAHLFGWNGGRVVTKYDDDGRLWVAFQCSGCGKVSGAHQTFTGFNT
jgi:hypothetical protein